MDANQLDLASALLIVRVLADKTRARAAQTFTDAQMTEDPTRRRKEEAEAALDRQLAECLCVVIAAAQAVAEEVEEALDKKDGPELANAPADLQSEFIEIGEIHAINEGAVVQAAKAAAKRGFRGTRMTVNGYHVIVVAEDLCPEALPPPPALPPVAVASKAPHPHPRTATFNGRQ